MNESPNRHLNNSDFVEKKREQKKIKTTKNL
jgi:hypothetical protein